jgi:hypothetical protein
MAVRMMEPMIVLVQIAAKPVDQKILPVAVGDGFDVIDRDGVRGHATKNTFSFNTRKVQLNPSIVPSFCFSKKELCVVRRKPMATKRTITQHRHTSKKYRQ